MTLYVYRATLLRIVDGDTLDLRISLGLDVKIDQRIRLYGINTPELNSPDPAERERAQEARTFVTTYLPTHENGITLKTYKDRREKYGRYLGEIYAGDTVQSLNTALIEAGLAVPYLG